ncbi:type II toxin-antitoxin system Phd/YefM family antitoxin [Candidatus Dependentiae bacterium]|nr:type II toxin-antitoxin system Phd/YefM family antitoxin [Candidatus Dependentiae bacterium]
MPNVYSLTKAKASLSAIINDVQSRKEKIFITKKKKNVAVIMPFSEYARNNSGNGLLNAAGAMTDEEVDRFVDIIYSERKKSSEREVSL